MPTAKIETERDCRMPDPAFTIAPDLVAIFRDIGEHKFKVVLSNTPPLTRQEHDDIIVHSSGVAEWPDGSKTVSLTWAPQSDQ